MLGSGESTDHPLECVVGGQGPHLDCPPVDTGSFTFWAPAALLGTQEGSPFAESPQFCSVTGLSSFLFLGLCFPSCLTQENFSSSDLL